MILFPTIEEEKADFNLINLTAPLPTAGKMVAKPNIIGKAPGYDYECYECVTSQGAPFLSRNAVTQNQVDRSRFDHKRV